MNPIKLTTAKRLHIQPGSTGLIKVNEEITIPMTAVGKFFIRLSLGKLGLIPSDSPFRPGWTGVPEGIVVTNAGANPVEIPAGKELGEIYLLALANTSYQDSITSVDLSGDRVDEVLLRALHSHNH